MNNTYDYAEHFISDGRTKYRFKTFKTDNAKEITLSNDDRKYLLTLFDTKRGRYNAIAEIVFGILGFVLFAIVCGTTFGNGSINGVEIIVSLILLLPPALVIVAGIYNAVTHPTIEKGTFKAYEFEVEKIKRVWKRGRTFYQEELIKVSSQMIRDDNIKLGIGGSWITVKKNSGYSLPNDGIKAGNKVRVAVLVYGKHMLISLY